MRCGEEEGLTTDCIARLSRNHIGRHVAGSSLALMVRDRKDRLGMLSCGLE
jgi:hypothetical protein